MKRIMFILIALILCTGQMCGNSTTPSDNNSPTSDTESQDESANETESIPENDQQPAEENNENPDSDLTPHISATECLFDEDVLSILPGNAEGAKFSGQYIIISGYMESCRTCPSNRTGNACEDISPIVEEGKVITVEQVDGIITLYDSQDTLIGGVNSDGVFAGGSVSPVVDNNGEVIGQGTVLMEGKFIGDIIKLTATMRATFNDDEGLKDIQFVNNVTYRRCSGEDCGDTRLAVTDTLRTACDGFLDDAGIMTLITRMENERLDGIPKSTQISYGSSVCSQAIENNPGGATTCLNCNSAITNQVYGY